AHLMADRLGDAVKLSPLQRCIRGASGCTENSLLLQTAMRQAKTERRELCIAMLDQAKAFDTVSHQHVRLALERLGVAPLFIERLEKLYTGGTTRFRVGKSQTGPIPIMRGVKQGDPLSSILFNIALDPLLCAIQAQQNGFVFKGDHRIEILGFSDDTALLTDNRNCMQRNLDLVDDFCFDTGLSLNVGKSFGFRITPGQNRTWILNLDSNWLLQGEQLEWIDPGASMKYLGTHINPWTGVGDGMIRDGTNQIKRLEGWCSSLKKAALRGPQKAAILTDCLVPKLQFTLNTTEPTRTLLISLDVVIRKHFQRWIKLPDVISTPFFYTSVSRGGLGAPKLQAIVPRMVLKSRGRAMRQEPMTRSSIVADVLESDGLEARMEKFADLFDIGEARWRTLERRKWSNQRVQGSGVKAYDSKEANAWNRWPMVPSWRKAMIYRIRTDTVPLRVSNNRGRTGANVRCRFCGAWQETLCHVLSACPKTLPARIKRHDAVCSAVSKSLTKAGYQVMEEPHIRLGGNGRLLKPDILAINDEKSEALVVDPTVVWETKDPKKCYIDHARKKVDKYKVLVPDIKAMLGVETVLVYGIVLGVRGGYFAKNDALFEHAGVTGIKQLKEALCYRALSGSVDVVNAFNDFCR
ncbi:MAG: hypothetical protein DSY80_05495, partial [Desulfocapsa sp.]